MAIPQRIPSDQMTMGANQALVPGASGLSNTSPLTMAMDYLQKQGNIQSPTYNAVRQAVTPSNDPLDMAMAFGAGVEPAKSYSWLAKAPESIKNKVHVLYDNATGTGKVLHSYDKSEAVRQITANRNTGLTPIGAFQVDGTALKNISNKPLDESILDEVADKLKK